MYKIEAIIQPEKLDELKNALVDAQIMGMTIYKVEGFGKQRGHKQYYRGTPVTPSFINKIKVEIVVSSEEWRDKAVDIIMKTANTGETGAGKIFISKIDKSIRIRTGETDYDALN